MEKKALTLASCIALATPTITIAQALPSNLVGLNLGEIEAKSFLNEPFEGFIPFLFTSADSAKDYKVRLAPQSIFTKIGAEKLAILNDLRFKVTEKAGKPVISILSNKPIQLPFLNFVLEVESPQGVVYQDYTVLLDPPDYQQQQSSQANEKVAVHTQTNNIANTALFFDTYAAASVTQQTLKQYTVKKGDSLSTIAQTLKPKSSSLASMVKALYDKNPKAFIRSDINKIKHGAVLSIPTENEILNGVSQLASKHENPSNVTSERVSEKTKLENAQYTVKQGDNLYKVTRQFKPQGESFSKTLNAIFEANPNAFSNNNKSLLKTGATLTIPSLIAESDLSPRKDTESKITTPENNDVSKNTTTEQVASNKTDTTAEEIKKAETVEKKPIVESVQNDEQKTQTYTVKQGDTLASIVKNLGYQEPSFTKNIKTLFENNLNAFENQQAKNIIVGSVLNLSSLSEIKSVSEKSQTNATKATPAFLNVSRTDGTSASSKIELSRLEKRIRELRAELNKTKTNLNDLETTLEEKDNIISAKDALLVDLKSSIVKSRISNTEKTESLYGVIDEEEQFAELATVALAANQASQNGFNAKLYQFIETTFSQKNAKNLSYGALALLLSLLLIRYRREIYSYTTISYDHPNYYPAPDADQLSLKEKNISFNDDHLADLANRELPEETQQLINDVNQIDESEPEEVQHCEHLVTELFDEINPSEDLEAASTEWESIEKVCDTYIESVKENNEIEASMKDTSEADLDSLSQEDDKDQELEVADFDVMMNDLLSSLNEVEETITKNELDQEIAEITAEQDEEIDQDVEEALEIFDQYQAKG